MILIPIIAVLVLINLLLLKFSCDSGDSTTRISRKKLKVNTPKIWSQQESNSDPIFADK
ncbi:hypothetical protein SAMN04488027_11521 [Psychroflexus sediminis]|uniref:Uncharacterized protein n=1 Tax=Psychroflexus sediminis TaxID=470826 RepID=A0A1G7YXM1_9FLAO|nr:hypothetical protein SAMN04488027_11521 [Psychroflexus sediminis]